MTEAIIVPRVKTETETIHSPISKCGDNWWKDVRVRCPYLGTDTAFRTLPSLGDPGQVEHLDPEFLEEMLVDHARITKFVSRKLNKLSDQQRQNIAALLNRAAAYIRDAKTIWQFWATGFSTTNAGKIAAWPLNGHPYGQINANIEEGHAKDVEKWRRLVRAALRNLRCAEEVVKKATIRLRNKERHKGRVFSGIGGLAPDAGNGGGEIPKRMTFVPTDTSPEDEEEEPLDDELEEGEIDLEEEPIDGGEESTPPPIPEEEEQPVEEEIEEVEEDVVETAPASKKKKKDNTLLIAGAAALGILAFSKG